MKNRLSGLQKISLTIDAWTSPFKQDFLGVTAYWISDDWKHEEMILGFESLSGSHTGKNLAAALSPLLEEYDLGEKLFTITSDNASNMRKMCAVLEEHAIESNW